jgi:hypothetical protein
MNQPDQAIATPQTLVATPGPSDAAPLSEHLIPLPGGRWALWRLIALRGAGFPAAPIFALASAECAAAADRLLHAEEAAERAEHSAAADVIAALDALRHAQQWQDAERRDPLVRLLRTIKKGKLPGAHDAALIGDAALAALHSTRAEVDAAWLSVRQAFAAALAQTSQTIYDIAQLERFREALIWQNRHAFHTAVKGLRPPSGSAARSSKQRQHEELIATYWQRYCVKNDTIGFFGPVGWAQIVSDGPAVTAVPGADLLAERNAYLEIWGIDALAAVIAKNRAIYPWVAPRRDPLVYLDGTTLYTPKGAPLTLSAVQAAIMQACDGQHTAKELAAQLIRTPASGLHSEVEVYNHLAILRNKGLILWTLEIPYEMRPELTLRRLLERLDDERVRWPALDILAEYEAARDKVADAAGDAAQLDQALGDLEATFTRLSGIAPTRFHGRTYAGRTLIYEDCRRDLTLSFGPALLATLGPPLSLLLMSARWFTSELGTVYRKVFQEVYTAMVQQAGSPTVELTSFWLRTMPLLAEDKSYIEAILARFQERWSAILALPPDQRRVAYNSAELRARVEAAFAAPPASWRAAYYHSPDVMIAAASADAIKRDEYQFVLGELHIGVNTLGAALFLQQLPSQDAFFQALDRDLPEPRVVPLPPRQWPGLTRRTVPVLVSPKDFRLEMARDSPGEPGMPVLPIGALVVEQSGAGLVARTRDGRHRFDIMETFAGALMLLAPNYFKLFGPAPHMPRVTLDRLVIMRESWHVSAAELPFAYDKDEAARFVAVRRWARSQGMPRFVFVRVPVEAKPFYLDFDSPIYVDIFAKMIRRTVENSLVDLQVGISEMLPEPAQMWLPDAQDQRYASELRIVALDLER